MIRDLLIGNRLCTFDIQRLVSQTSKNRCQMHRAGTRMSEFDAESMQIVLLFLRL